MPRRTKRRDTNRWVHLLDARGGQGLSVFLLGFLEYALCPAQLASAARRLGKRKVSFPGRAERRARRRRGGRGDGVDKWTSHPSRR